MLKIQKDILKKRKPARAQTLQRFFKTAPGEYAEGDIFWGLTVPESRSIAKKYADLSLKDVRVLIKSKIHEERLIGLLILVGRFAKSPEKEQEKIYQFYLKNTRYINNWDLVDSSAEYIVGSYLYERDRSILCELAKSPSLWERRIAMLSTFHFIKRGEYKDTLKIAKILLNDPHDLIHKAVGWMLREAGKRVSEQDMRKFLDVHAPKMPRTMLRYAIERLPATDRQYYLKLKSK
ncbi:MAG: DNA alkylation repair protein [Bdellovibrio sp. ArHS]|uniref:DNA alkylation repair protein n=1 Tax=Bdellovibrio sp. ArHS TaxID=1569284 RepID=UPI000583D1A1|nr:DNA alkylation repair protein [Bdellovibrio sp. ArHS]KHD89970.1 MAG: DNA alkylation repair protein [Bdellovibrio sp. ArHS]